MRIVKSAGLVLGLALAAAPAYAGLEVGDKAPMPKAKETVGIPSFSPKDVEGKVVLYDIFRTW